MATLSLQNIRKSFGTVEVLNDISLEVEEGEFCVFVGPSGCGKSTLLRVIAGLEDASSGSVKIGGKDVSSLPPAKRGIAMVFQTYALYPHLSVKDNMSLGLKQAKRPAAYIAERVAFASKMLELDDYLNRRPSELSGGQRQRVAIGRAIVRKPDLFLFDEPLSNLDAALRVNTRLEIARLHRELGASMVYVTHDQIEAMTLADKIVVLRDGKVEQVGPPMELYNNPDNQFVAGFLGAPGMNFIPGAAMGEPDVATIGLRPEHLALDDGGKLAGRVAHVEQLGGDTNAFIDIGGKKLLTLRLFGQHPIALDAEVRLGIDPAQVFRFDAAGARLRE